MQLNRRAALTAVAAVFSGCGRATSVNVPARTEAARVGIESRPLLTLSLSTAAPQDLGMVPTGGRVIYPITGGKFEGERLQGRVLPGGADWTLKSSDGAVELDLHVSLETHDAALVYMTFSGVRDDAHGYFRTVARFETAAPDYAFLNRLLAVGMGKLEAGRPVHVFEEIL